MSQYVDIATGEYIDAAQFRRQQARLIARQLKARRQRNRIYRYVREPEPQTLRRFVCSIPRVLWDKHYGEIMLIIGLIAALSWWGWYS